MRCIPSSDHSMLQLCTEPTCLKHNLDKKKKTKGKDVQVAEGLKPLGLHFLGPSAFTSTCHKGWSWQQRVGKAHCICLFVFN